MASLGVSILRCSAINETGEPISSTGATGLAHAILGFYDKEKKVVYIDKIDAGIQTRYPYFIFNAINSNNENVAVTEATATNFYTSGKIIETVNGSGITATVNGTTTALGDIVTITVTAGTVKSGYFLKAGTNTLAVLDEVQPNVFLASHVRGTTGTITVTGATAYCTAIQLWEEEEDLFLFESENKLPVGFCLKVIDGMIMGVYDNVNISLSGSDVSFSGFYRTTTDTATTEYTNSLTISNMVQNPDLNSYILGYTVINEDDMIDSSLVDNPHDKFSVKPRDVRVHGIRKYGAEADKVEEFIAYRANTGSMALSMTKDNFATYEASLNLMSKSAGSVDVLTMNLGKPVGGVDPFSLLPDEDVYVTPMAFIQSEEDGVEEVKTKKK